jgi:hypothetical protein
MYKPRKKKPKSPGVDARFIFNERLLCMFDCFEPYEQFFSYLATVTMIGNRAANLDLCLALGAFSSESSSMCHTYCDKGPLFLMSYSKDP